MISFFLAQQAAEAAQPDNSLAGSLQAIGFDGPRFLSQVFLFIIVAWALKKFAYEPILKILDERRAAIASGLENAAKSKQELANAEAQRHDIIRQANETANRMVEDAKKSAEVAAQRRLQEATREAEQIVTSARQATAQEREKVFAEMRKELVRLVIDATGKATGKILTADDQERIKNETLSEVSRN